MSHNKKTENNLNAYKMTAQSVGLIVCAFFLFFLIGEGIPDLINGRGNELIKFLPVLLLPIAGYFITWFREQAGAVIMVAGGFLLIIYLLTTNGMVAALIYGLPFIFSGALFLLHIFKKNQIKTRH